VIHAGMSTDSVYLWTLPMFHCNGWCFPWAVTAVAARHVSIRTVDPDGVWEMIDGEGVTHYNGAPTVQLMIIHHPRAHRLTRPVTVMVAAAPRSPTLFARMSELNFRVVHVYGLTETYGPTTVVMRGNNVMSGYLDDQAATAKAFAGGWFHSGDLAVWHPDGNIELRDRSKDIIISGGENISSIEVQQAIVAHPGVLEAAVIGVPTSTGASVQRHS
jgi:fatty-acyl-CoA synthase